MKRMLTIFLLLLLFATQYQTIFATFATPEELPQIKEERMIRLQEIFEERSKIWNTLFDQGETIELLAVEEQLSILVGDKLLETDLKLFESLKESPTSFERIMGIQIVKYKPVYKTDSLENWEVTMLWELEGYEGIVTEKVRYLIEMENINEKWLLSDYHLLYNE